MVTKKPDVFAQVKTAAARVKRAEAALSRKRGPTPVELAEYKAAVAEAHEAAKRLNEIMPAVTAAIQKRAESMHAGPGLNDQENLIAAREAYYKAFETAGPHPMEVSDSEVARVLWEAVRQGKPVPRDYDWYPDLPPGAVV